MNRRQIGEENYRQKFEKLGLSDSFDFVCRDWSSDKGSKVIVKCKTCGAEFSTWGFDQILRGRQSHLLCIECGVASDGNDVWERSHQCDEAMAYYVDGHTVRQTAERFGVSIAQINNSVKIRGLTNGRSWRDCQEHITQQKQDAESRLADRLDELGYDYLGGYMDKTGRITIRCRTCDDVFERSVSFVRNGNLICRKCEHEKALIRQAERKEERAEELRQKEINRKQNQKRAEAEKADALFHLLNDKTHICSVCGKHFSISEFMESKGRTLIPANPKYCSQKCNRKAMNKARKKAPSGRTGNYYNRARKYGCEYVPGITLKKLIKRDGLRCKICGKMCDPNDHTWTEYSGPLSPSIDHIIPMEKKGGHVWNNVQIAHIICNSEKGDKIDKVV